MTTETIDFLKGYNGNNAFVHSLKTQYQKKGTLSPKQAYFLQLEMSKTNKNQPTQTKVVQQEKEEANMSMATFEPIEETTPVEETNSATPNVDHIEKMLAKIAGQVVAETMAKANSKLDAVILKAEKAVANAQKSVLHVRVNGGNVVNLSSEAHELLPKIIANAKLGENTLLMGPAGCGKTTLAKQLSEALALPFGFLCLSAGVSETWLYGRQTPQGFVEGEFSKFYRNGGVFLLDEIDAADANLLLSINTALANGSMYNPILGEKIKRHENFVCVAAANTFGLGGNAQYTGRNRLDAATLDRFATLKLDYSKALEARLCADTKLLEKLHKARETLEARNALQVISTRAIERTAKLINAGYTEAEAMLAAFAQSWPKGLTEEIGLIKAQKIEANF